MRKFAFIMAAAVCLTAGSALTVDTASAQSIVIGVGQQRDHNWRDDRNWSDSRWRSDRGFRSFGRSCRMVTVTTRTMLSNGRVMVRRTQRCR